jgi:thiol:disulfide interchange protein
MSDAYKPILVIFAVILVVAVIVSVRRFREPGERVQWGHDWAAAQSQSKSSGRPMLAYFTASWCGPCQRMKSTTFANEQVDAALGEFIKVKIDVDESPKLASQYATQGIPCFYLFAGDGTIQGSTVGYMEPGEFIDWIKHTARMGGLPVGRL